MASCFVTWQLKFQTSNIVGIAKNASLLYWHMFQVNKPNFSPVAAVNAQLIVEQRLFVFHRVVCLHS